MDNIHWSLIILIIMGVILMLSFILCAIRDPKLVINSIRTLPRDLYGVYIYCRITVFCYYCKFKDLKAAQRFDSTAAKHMDKVCFYFEDEIWTFAMVQDMTLKVAKFFQDMGYKKGDVVGLFMDNRPEFVCIWLGLSRLGVVTSLLNYNLRLNSLEHCIRVSKCKGLIFGSEFTNAIQELADSEAEGIKSIQLFSLEDRTTPEKRLSTPYYDLSHNLNSIDTSKIKPEDFGKDIRCTDIVLHMFTSGTTGMPKAVLMTQSRLFTYGSVFFPCEMNAKKDVLLTPIPLYHVQGGLLGVTCAIFHGVPQVIVRKFSASNFWKQCIKYDVTYCQYLGEIIRYLYNQPERPEDKLHKVHTFYGNGVNPAIWEKFVTRFNIKVKEMYGSTEGNCSIMNLEGRVGAIAYFPRWLLFLLPVFFAKVDPLTGEVMRNVRTGLVIHAKINEPGEVMGAIKESNPMREFNGYTDDEATKKKVIYDVRKKGDSWFRTGDLVRMDEMGNCYFVDRTGDTFRWKGENVSTAEVEQVLIRASDCKCVTVYGVAVEGYEGKCGMAAIADPQGTLDLNELATAAERYLPAYARPVFVRVCDAEMQMTGTFKLQKTELQNEGFDVRIIRHPVYYFKDGKYHPLNEEIYYDIISGKIRI